MTNIKVGDEIAYGRFHLNVLIRHGVSVVASINRHGHVCLENGLLFDKYGRERNNQYSAMHLMPVAELQKYLDAQQSRIERQNKISNIKSLVDNLNTNGVDSNTKAQLIDLINSL
jgi:hypothetical protein